jgi:hypothetical protein
MDLGWHWRIDPSTALKPRSGERGKKSRSGSTLSMPRAEARGSRRVDFHRFSTYAGLSTRLWKPNHPHLHFQPQDVPFFKKRN